jgi:hypothetical protein
LAICRYKIASILLADMQIPAAALSWWTAPASGWQPLLHHGIELSHRLDMQKPRYRAVTAARAGYHVDRIGSSKPPSTTVIPITTSRKEKAPQIVTIEGFAKLKSYGWKIRVFVESTC